MTENCSKAKILFCLLVIGGFFIWVNFSLGAAANDVIINEIAWMGTTESANDEWIELKNNTAEEIDLTGWTLKAVDGTPEITLSGTIAAHGYFLLERTDDDSRPDKTAEQIYTGALNNSGEVLHLLDSENNLIDSVDCSDGWLAGDNKTKQTMKRTANGWQNNPEAEEKSRTQDKETENNNRVPPAAVNRPPVAKAGTDTAVLVNQEISFDGSLSYDPDNDSLTYFWNFGDGTTDTQEKTGHSYFHPGQYIVSLMVNDGEFCDLDIITVNVYTQPVLISEFAPNQWIEIFNQSNQIANLAGWRLNNFIFPANSLIAPGQFLVLPLNNDQGQVRLFYPNGSLAAKINYGQKTEKELSVAFDGQEYFWTKVPTPGSVNIISNNPPNRNPQPVVQETREAPEISSNFNLGQSQGFSALTPKNKATTKLLPQQAASLAQSSQSKQKANLVLIISIIISVALLASWLLIRLTLSRSQ